MQYVRTYSNNIFSEDTYSEKRTNSAFKQVAITKDVFVFEKPELTILNRTFNDIHNLIRNKDSLLPTKAFYEFSKIMFIKLKKDNEIHQIINQGKKPQKRDFVFSTFWIDDQIRAEPNPFDNILFRQIQKTLEKDIHSGKKKRIFDDGERLELTPSTIYEIVKALQNYDLYGVDEDLNGRMFETFLNATVRGKELGQFFTPRGVVHYMVDSSPMVINVNMRQPIEDNIPFVLDGCCGSGGFLIDSMASLTKKIDSMSQLTNFQKEEYKTEMKNNHLFGIDSNDAISRISRLNMYLHGDGGSKIFKANALDKELILEKGLSDEEREGIEELKEYLFNKKIRFDIILSNPPFSIEYKVKDQNQKRILKQYTLVKNSSGSISSSESSNVLFLERYCEILKNGTGELLTVIDDTVLNGDQSQKYRDYILKHFIIIQIISLPFNTFFRANANIKTSIIHLRKKASLDEKQGDIFMAITNNIGHDDHKIDTPSRNNLPLISKYFLQWQSQGKIETQIIPNEDKDESLGCPLQIFTISSKKVNPKRLDALYYSPELEISRQNIMRLKEEGKIELKKGNEFNIIPIMNRLDTNEAEKKIFKYFEIGDVTIDGTIVNHTEDYFENLPTRGRLKVQKNDIIFAKNNSSRGTTVIIPDWFDGGLVTTGFIGIRPNNYGEALILWTILESEFFRQQIYYLAITASQPEIRENIFKEEILIPWPKSIEDKNNIISKAQRVDDMRNNLKRSLNDAKETVNSIFFY